MITDIEHVQGTKRARRVWIDGEPWRITSAAAIKALGLAVGQTIEPEVLAASCEHAERTAARERVLRLLGRRDFSAHQVRTRLYADGYPEHIVQETVARFAEAGMLDDARYAAGVVRSRFRSGHGPRRIAHELLTNGVAPQIVDQALSDAMEEGASPDAAALAQRLLRPSDDTARLAQRLLRRGFDGDTAYRAAREALSERKAPDTG